LIKRFLPKFFLDVYRAYIQARKVKFNPRFYKEVDIWKI